MRWLLYLLIFVASFAIYQESWSNSFVLDDMTKIQENTDLRTPFNLENFIYPYADARMHFRNDPSRPLTYIMYWVCWHIGDGSPTAFHILSTLLHAFSAMLIAILFLRLSRILFGGESIYLAGAAAFLFLTSPLMAGTVAYAFGLSDVLGAFFILATLLTFVGFERPTWFRIADGCALYFLALASKQSGVIALPLLIACDYFTCPQGGLKQMLKDRARTYGALTAMTAIYLLTRWLYFGGIGDLEGINETVPAFDYFTAESVIIFKYLKLIFLPIGFAIDHQPKPADFALLLRIAGWCAIVGASVFALIAAKTARARSLAWGWVFFLICLLPVSSFLPTVDLFVERRAYLAAAGILIAICLLAATLPQRSRQFALLLMILGIGGQTALAIERIHIYGSTEKLWLESLAEWPDNPRALINLGVFYSAQENWIESRQVLERLAKLQPQNGSIYTKLAYIYHQPNYAGRNDERAWELYMEGLHLMPDNIFALYNAGVFQMEKKNYLGAVAYFDRAIKLSPAMTKAIVAAGQAEWEFGDKDKAKSYFRQALEVDPTLETPKQYLQR